MATEVTVSTIAKIADPIELEITAATADTADLAEDFEFAPTKGGSRLIIGIQNGSSDDLSYEIAAGDLWASQKFEGIIDDEEIHVLKVDTAKYKTSEGLIKITLTLANGKKLDSDHGAGIFIIEEEGKTWL